MRWTVASGTPALRSSAAAECRRSWNRSFRCSATGQSRMPHFGQRPGSAYGWHSECPQPSAALVCVAVDDPCTRQRTAEDVLLLHVGRVRFAVLAREQYSRWRSLDRALDPGYELVRNREQILV